MDEFKKVITEYKSNLQLILTEFKNLAIELKTDTIEGIKEDFKLNKDGAA